MSDLATFIQKYIPLLQKYILSANKKDFLAGVQNLTDKKIIQLLTQPVITEQLQAFMKEIKLSKNVINQIKNSKNMLQLRTATSQQKLNQAVKAIKQNYKHLNFQYTRPFQLIRDESKNQILNQQSASKSSGKSQLNLPQNLSSYLQEKLKVDQKYFNYLSDFGVKKLSTQTLKSMSIENKKAFIQNTELFRSYSDEFVVDYLFNTFEGVVKDKKTTLFDQIPRNLYYSLSKSQINLLGAKHPSAFQNSIYISQWFNVNYKAQLEELYDSNRKKKMTLSEMDKIRLIILKIQGQIKKINSKFLKSYQNQLFLQVLVLDLQRQDPSKELFIQYLESSDIVSPYFNKNLREQIKNKIAKYGSSSSNSINIGSFLSKNMGLDSLIDKYLVKLFQKYSNHNQLIGSLAKYLQEKLIRRYHVKYLLAKDQQVQNLHAILEKQEIQVLKQSKQISILADKTEDFFKVNDDVVLNLKIKNIKQIKLKIYEMDLEKYYLQNQSQIDAQINLSYLNPSIVEVIQVQGVKNSFHQIRHQLKLQKIKKKYGFYIVQLQGEGITSRAVIRKGSISCFEQNNIYGKKFIFYDDQGEIIEKLDLWVKGRHETISNGEYIIPFSKNYENFSIIVVKDKFAEKKYVSIGQQTYQFSASYIYNTESFIVGKKCKIIIHPVLKLGNTPISLQNLQNIKVSVDLINNQNIKSNMKFQNLKWDDQNDYILEFPIKSYTSFINISVSCEILNIQKKPNSFNHSKTITIDLGQSSTNFIDLYLRRTDNGRTNVLIISGINGQRLSGMQTSLNLYFFGSSQNHSCQLFSDENGQINLGSLSYVKNLQATVVGQGKRTRSWNIDCQIQQASYLNQSMFYFHQNQEIVLPIPFNWNLNKQNLSQYFTLRRNTNSRDDLLNQVEIKKQNELFLLCLPKLAKGYYNIGFIKFGILLDVFVVSGKQWKDGKIFDKETGTIYTLSSLSKAFISLTNLVQKKEKQDEKYRHYELNIYNPQKQELNDLRVHVVLQNYYDPIIPNVSDCFQREIYNNQMSFTQWQLSFSKSTYFNNKTLSDQQSYVLNRGNEKQFIGNNLEKPKIFLKRIEVRDTTVKDEVLMNEGSYKLAQQNSSVQKMCMDMKSKRMARCQQDDYCSGSLLKSLPNTLSSHNNYLPLSGNTITNIHGKKKIQICVPKGYSNINIYLTTQSTGIKKNYFISQEKNLDKKDLRHGGLLESSEKSGWTLSRQVYKLQKGQKKQINRDSTWCTVTLSNLLQFAQIKGHKLPQWISQWKNYSQDKKLEVFDKQICHQLNVFIKFHDNQFFQKTVLPHISNKINKTFIDLYLMSDKILLEYSHIQCLNRLNEFQKILLIDFLIKNNFLKEAQNISTSMELRQKNITRSLDQYKTLFDTILNAQAKNNAPKPIVPNIYQASYCPPPPGMNAAFGMNQMSFDQQFTAQRCQQSKSIERKRRMPSRSHLQLGEMGGKAPLSSLQYKPGFQQVQKTKQYTQTTYSGMKNPKDSQNLISSHIFWAKLASHIVSKSKDQFLSQNFIYLQTKIQFLLASIFLNNEMNPDYDIEAQGNNFIINAKSPFLIFVKEVKQLQYSQKFGVLINQRFFNPDDKFSYEEDGTQIQKIVDQFISRRPYCVQTIITNTSGTALQLQLLIDIPSGGIPLLSHQYAQIINTYINAYSTLSFERYFYFPAQGQFKIYPANACRNNIVISKARKLQNIVVKSKQTVNKLENFNDVMRSGSQKQILEFIQKKNIFDYKMFDASSILWMLKDKQFYNQVLQILRSRNYFQSNIWSFSFYHNDVKGIKQYLESTLPNGLNSYQIPIFQYFPYYSNRTHKFMNQSKSTIRNVQFKQTYRNFVYRSLLEQQFRSSQKLAMAYYLLLQDRIDECFVMFKSMSSQQKSQHLLQCDYLQCYLDMYQGYPNFTIAKQLSKKYINYSVSSWQKLFKQINDTLNQYQNDATYVDDSSIKKQNTEYKTKVINQGEQLKISVPPTTKVEVYFYDIDLELYFSDYPFDDVKSLSVIKPKICKVFTSGQSRQQTIHLKEVCGLANVMVEVYQFKEDVPACKIFSFFWVNPKIKVKVNQNQGNLQVFYQGRKQSGCYVKVYSSGNKGKKFYRDGYTDITGTFKYALADLQSITQFSILTITKQGGIINKVAPPSTAAYFS